MKKLWPWLFGLSVFLLLVVFVVFGLRFIPLGRSPMAWGEETNQFWRDGFWDHHGRGMHWGIPGLPFLGIFGMLFALLLPLGFVALLVLGIIFLVRTLRSSSTKPNSVEVPRCHNCGKQVEGEWVVCPYCGENLGGA